MASSDECVWFDSPPTKFHAVDSNAMNGGVKVAFRNAIRVNL